MNIVYEIPVKNPSDSDAEGGIIGGTALHVPINAEMKESLELDQEVTFLIKGHVRMLESTERNDVSDPERDDIRLEVARVELVNEETNEFSKMADEEEA